VWCGIAAVLVFLSSCSNAKPEGPQFIEESVSRFVNLGFETAQSECMKREGFRFIIVPPVPPLGLVRRIGEPRRLADGYGITHAVAIRRRKPRSNPNIDYVGTLSPGDRDAYDEALNGSASKRGCYDEGYAEFNRRAAKVDSAFGRERVLFDQQDVVKNFRDQWHNSMTKAGWSFGTRTELVVSLLNLFTKESASGKSDDDLLVREQKIALDDRNCIPDAEEQRFQHLSQEYFDRVSIPGVR
jgi:hypothetical protein